MKRYIFVIFLLVVAMTASAKVGDVFLTEKIFVAPQSSYCMKGENVILNGQVLSSDYADFYPYSRYVYIEFIDTENSVLSRQKVRIANNGTFSAVVNVGAKYPDGVYFVRAYTQFMLNRKASSLPMVPVFVGMRPAEKQSDAVGAIIAPEGGKLLAGCKQTVTVYVIDANRVPVRTQFTVINRAKGDEPVCSGETSDAGLATFQLTPAPGDSLAVQVRKGSTISTFAIPVDAHGVALQATIRRSRVYCKALSTAGALPDSARLWAYHPYFGIQPIALDTSGMGVADIKGCAPGVLTLWLTDDGLNTLAQRSLWIKDTNDSIPQPVVKYKPVCKTDENPLSTITDTVKGCSAMVRITPEWDHLGTDAFGALNFTNELSSAIPFPQRAADADVNAWLLSASHAFLSPKMLLADSIAYPYAVEAALHMSGIVHVSRGKPLSGGTMQVFNQSTGDAATCEISPDGHFDVALTDFLDRSKIYLQAIDQKGKPGQFIYNIDELKYPDVVNNSPFLKLEEALAERNISAVKMSAYQADDVELEHQLGELTVTRKKITGQTMFELFHQKTPINFVSRKDIERFNIISVEDALKRMTIVQVKRGETRKLVSEADQATLRKKFYPNDYKAGSNSSPVEASGKIVVWTNSMRVSSIIPTNGHGKYLDFVVDGLKIDQDFDVVLSMDMGIVETLEIVPASDPRSVMHLTPCGFVEIKTRLGIKPEEISSNGITFQPLGLSESLQGTEPQLPQSPGNYRVNVDIVSPDRSVTSSSMVVEYQ